MKQREREWGMKREPDGVPARLARFFGAFLALMMLGGALCFSAAEESVTYQGWRSVTVDRETEELDLGDLEIDDWEPFYTFLEQLPKLKKVEMYRSVPNLEVFETLHERFPGVEFGVSLRFGHVRMRTDDTAFSTLYIGGSKLHSYEEIARLRYCKNLYALDVGHQPVRKLDFLYDLPELRVLIVAICELTDITPIASLQHLEYLEIFHNDIEDISCLKDLPYLMDLNLVKNRVKDLTPLKEMKSLRRLWIHLYDQDQPEMPDEETLRQLREALPDCHIDAESTSTAGGWRRDPHYSVIDRMFRSRKYEPFADSKPENIPEPWRSGGGE